VPLDSTKYPIRVAMAVQTSLRQPFVLSLAAGAIGRIEGSEVRTDMKTGASVSVMVREEMGHVSGLCPAMQSLESVIAEIAPTNIPVLFAGESGTGKAIYAQQLHRLSGRDENAFARVTCAALNAATFASELEAHTIGNGSAGTVLFDEVTELESACQGKLLYALPDGEHNPRMGTLQARVVSTTSRNLDEEMRAGRFRADLYYRINGVCLRLPPLRERREDIPLLVEFFLTKHSAQFGRPRPLLTPRTVRILMDHAWPGNIRELENVVKQIVALGDEQRALAGLEAAPVVEERVEPLAAPTAFSLKAAARAASRVAEREMILKALEHTRWNRKRAAQELQISYKSLLYKLKQIGFEDSAAE
jgi:two-component system, NtrC family, response regulator AtoC